MFLNCTNVRISIIVFFDPRKIQYITSSMLFSQRMFKHYFGTKHEVYVSQSCCTHKATYPGVRLLTFTLHYRCDVSNREEVMTVAKQVREDVGDVTILINNAGIMPCQPFLEHSEREIRRLFDINVLAHFWVRHNHSVGNTDASTSL